MFCIVRSLSCACAFKSSGLFTRFFNALLTKKLPMFLSRLNEINGGWEKILPVSGSFFFRMMDVSDVYTYTFQSFTTEMAQVNKS